MDDAELYILRQSIASMLDHPSVYMGGPSQQAIRKAIKIVEFLSQNYKIEPTTEDDAAHVRTWRKSPWDSLERV